MLGVLQYVTKRLRNNGASVRAFTMANRRRAIVNARTDRTRIFYRTCEMKHYRNLYPKLMGTIMLSRILSRVNTAN